MKVFIKLNALFSVKAVKVTESLFKCMGKDVWWVKSYTFCLQDCGYSPRAVRNDFKCNFKMNF